MVKARGERELGIEGQIIGATTFSMTTLGIMTLSIATFGIMTLSITQDAYAECCYRECQLLCAAIRSIMLSVIIPSVIKLSVVAPRKV